MAQPAWRWIASIALLIVVLLIGAGRLASTTAQVAAQAPEQFTQLNPLKVYSGIPTHPGLADANPTGGTNGYCVTVAGAGHSAPGSDRGFTVANGTILSTSFFDNGSAVTTDDVYCAVARATRIVTVLPRPDMVLSWTYLESGLPNTITLNIAVVSVALKGTNGFLYGVTSVCTEGWDPTFLTGFNANTPPALPFVLDTVIGDDPPAPSDWATVPASVNGVGPVIGSPLDILGVARDTATSQEWCLNITRGGVTALFDIDASIRFWAMYDSNQSGDDQDITEAQAAVVDIELPDKPELRHLTPIVAGNGGQVIPDQIARPNVIGATHTACVLPSVTLDVINPNDVSIATISGQPSVLGKQVFHNTGQVPGVPQGTICISWNSNGTGIQAVTAFMTVHPTNPTFPNLPAPQLVVTWDTNGDANGGTVPGGPIFVHWDTIESTVITTGGKVDQGVVTGKTITVPVNFNLVNGSFLASPITLYEWVLGGRPNPLGATGELLNGVPLTLSIVGPCGYFIDGDPTSTVLTGPDIVTVDGRFKFEVFIDNDLGCNLRSLITVEIRTHYPPSVNLPDPAEIERVSFQLVFVPAISVPQLAWAGQIVTVSYGFSGDCDAVNTITFFRPDNQPGTFLPGAGVALDGPNTAFVVPIDGAGGCAATVQYESEIPGTVDISAFITSVNINAPRIAEFSKVVFPIFFMVFESLTLTHDPNLVVSERGDLDANIKGWFIGDNHSGRPQEVVQGMNVPANRWVLPDDWEKLRGDADSRGAWPSEAPMPPARVTFYMRNEGVKNVFKSGVKNGAAGFFLHDAFDEFSENVDTDTGIPSVLGSFEKPRIISELTDDRSLAQVDIFGDLNLSFEACAVNQKTGNPHCKPGDIAGRTTYFAIADYITGRGKNPIVIAPDVTTVFTWSGYKDVTIVDGEAPQYKYVVAHLKDRDGFCDAVSYNNTLGVPVDFKIDAGDGIIVGAADRPFTIHDTRQFALATTFDTKDDAEAPMNLGIAKPVIAEDECQAWIKVSNSLLGRTNVLVTFPAPASQVPGPVRVTNLVCGIGGTVTVTNTGAHPVSLAGFAIRSIGGAATNEPEAHLGLEGYLEPGQSKTFSGRKLLAPWINGSDENLADPRDYARLIWEEQTISLMDCAGIVFNPPLPLIPLDGEGEIQLDVIVEFTAGQGANLVQGWNLVSVGASDVTIAAAAGTNLPNIEVVFGWDSATQTWERFVPGAPANVNTTDTFKAGRAYWVKAKEPFTLALPR